METVFAETGVSYDCQSIPGLGDKQKKRSEKKKRKSRKHDYENGNADESFSSGKIKQGETEKSTHEDQVQLSEYCFSTLPAESCQPDSISCVEPGVSTREDSLPVANKNGSFKKKTKRRAKKKKKDGASSDAETTTKEDQLHPPNNPLSNNTIQEETRKYTQDSCEKLGAAQLCTDPNLSMQEDLQPDATKMTSSRRRKKKRERDTNTFEESGVDFRITTAEVAAKYNTISEAEGSKSMNKEEKSVASVVIKSCLKSKDDTVEQRECTDVKFNETVVQTQIPKAKKRKKRKTKSVEVCDPLGNSLATAIKSGHVESVENNDGNGGRWLMSQRENSAAGEEIGFHNLEKSKEKEADENTEVKEDVLGAGACDVRSKKRKGKKKKTSSADHKSADMEVRDPGGSVECLLDHSNKEDMQKGNAEQFGGEDLTSKIEKSATKEKSGVQKSGKRKEMTKDENIESNQGALGAEGVSDVGRKRHKRKSNKNTNSESVAIMDSKPVQCLLYHSNREGVENCEGNADGEIASKDLASKLEDSATKGENAEDVENFNKNKTDEKDEVDQDALGAEAVSKDEVKIKKSKKKKNSLDHKTDNMEEKMKINKTREVEQNASVAEGVSNVEVNAKKSKKKKNSLDHKIDYMEEKGDVSLPRNDEEPEFDKDKLETSLSSSVLIQNNVDKRVASSESGDVPRCSCEGQRTRKLLIFDLNGILADIVQGYTGQFVPDGKVSYRSVFRRPFVSSFLDFCFERFEVAIWSSRRIGLDYMINIVMENYSRNLLFCFDQNNCTTTKFKTQEKNDKPLFLKDLRRVWERFGTCISCGKRKYDETNTLLVDDSPDKALCNPPHSGIFPFPYQYKDGKDSALGPEGELRKYLERLVDAENVQKFVAENPYGQSAITETHKSWEFYSEVIEAHK